MYYSKIKVLNNHEELEGILVGFKANPDFNALYRANVNATVTDIELLVIDLQCLKRACAAAIWINNHVGIVRQNRRREAYLFRFICELCSMHRNTLNSLIKKIGGRYGRRKRKASTQG